MSPTTTGTYNQLGLMCIVRVYKNRRDITENRIDSSRSCCVVRSLQQVKDSVFVRSQGGNIYKVNVDNGNEVWKIETDSNIIRSLDLGKNDFQTLISTGEDDENRMNLLISGKVYLKTYSNGNLRRVISDEKITLDEWNDILVTVTDDTAILYYSYCHG